jgi:hypothetical protein
LLQLRSIDSPARSFTYSKPYSCDLQNDATVTEIILSKSSFLDAVQTALAAPNSITNDTQFLSSMNIAYDSFRTKDGTAVNSFGSTKWFCSGKVHEAHSFGQNRGFVDRLYIFGEEADVSMGHGRFFALHEKTLYLISGGGEGDVSAVEVQGGMDGLPHDALENMALIDTGEEGHVILMTSPDYGTKALKMYVGRKGELLVLF